MERSTPPSPADLREATRDWAHLARAESTAQREAALAQRARAQEAIERSAALLAQARLIRDTRARDQSLPEEAEAGTSRLTGFPLEQLWVDYAAMGGDRTPREIADYLDGRLSLPDIEISIFGHVLNEYLMDQESSPSPGA